MGAYTNAMPKFRFSNNILHVNLSSGWLSHLGFVLSSLWGKDDQSISKLHVRKQSI